MPEIINQFWCALKDANLKWRILLTGELSAFPDDDDSFEFQKSVHQTL